jgi:hypothetical protein
MMRALVLLASTCVAVAVSGCGERAQTLGGMKNDVSAFQGSESRYVVSGWKAGDRTSWEQSLKARAQNSQNEYNKTR